MNSTVIDLAFAGYPNPELAVCCCRVAKPVPGSMERSMYPEELNFIDLAWGGPAETTCYPPFINHSSLRAIKKADGQPITQAHDSEQLRMNLKRLRNVPYRPRPPPAKGMLRMLRTKYACSSACVRTRALTV